MTTTRHQPVSDRSFTLPGALRRVITPALLLAALLQGCAAPLVVGGAAVGGAAVAHDRRTAGTLVDDQGIELKVADAISKDKALNDQAHINATSFNGIVLLTGEAPNQTLRARATSLASKVEKVRRVQNEIAIGKPSSLSSRSNDAWITTKVKTKLLTSDKVDGTRVKVVTEAGTVYLMGLVKRKEANEAVAVVRNTSGVKRVVKVFEYLD